VDHEPRRDPAVRRRRLIEVESIEIRTTSEARAIGERISAFLNERDPGGALSLVDALVGNEQLVTHARALAFTECGRQMKSRDLVLKGVAAWESLLGKTLDAEYNVANVEQALWDLAVDGQDFVVAMESEHKRLERARLLHKRAAENESLLKSVRLQAAVNLGNSFDLMGRELDAMEAWGLALGIDPNFAMARGNVGTALLAVAPYVGGHTPTVIREAASNLDFALERPDELVRFGGAEALKHFKKARARIKVAGNDVRTSSETTWPPDYFGWCREHELFLHVSHRCLRVGTKLLDPLFFARLNARSLDEGEDRVNDLVDAFNAIKQAYATARYTAWLAVSPGDAQKEELKEARRRIAFLDTLSYTRFGVRTGLAAQAFSAATNVLDQVASFLHLYLETGRDFRGVYFRTLWHKRHGRVMEPAFVPRLQRSGHLNRGLLALCDLASDLEQDTLLARLVDRRHAATHRFLVLHDLRLEEGDGPWVDRESWSRFCEELLAVLRIARSAIVYLARTVDIEESQTKHGEGPMFELPLSLMPDDLAELD
jgi:tetratricopeptide (TPR) repeat protein